MSYKSSLNPANWSYQELVDFIIEESIIPETQIYELGLSHDQLVNLVLTNEIDAE
jgi:hypothetical protein